LFSFFAVGVWIYLVLAAVILFALAVALIIFGCNERKRQKQSGIKRKYPTIMITIGVIILSVFLLVFLYDFLQKCAEILQNNRDMFIDILNE